jgi:protein-disulfide isomerase
MSDLRSATVPPVGAGEHVRGDGPEATLYFDLACPHCAAAWVKIGGLPLRLCWRHFPVASKHPRGPALHAAAEAAGLQRPDAFWEMCDSIYSDQGRQDDPHLWQRAKTLGLDLDRFERDRRSDAVSGRVRSDFEGGIRAGVTGTPTAFIGGEALRGDVAAALLRHV